MPKSDGAPTLKNSQINHENVDNYLSRKRNRIEDLFKLMNQEDSNIFKLPRIIGALAKDIVHPAKLTLDVAKTKNLKVMKATSKFVTV